MKRPVFAAGFPALARRRGFTLIEILVAVTLTLVMMGAVVQVFGMLGTGVNDSRAVLEMVERLRATEARLRLDLDGVTVTMNPPRDPAAEEGYFEYTEGPLWTGWQLVPASKPDYLVPHDVETTGYDYTVGDNDDYLMFTVRTTPDRPFIGRFGTTTVESTVAEIYWFVRGTTLYRRVLLVKPEVIRQLGNPQGIIPWTPSDPRGSFFNLYDISVRPVPGGLVPNTLGDLTMPECRYAHQRRDNNGPLFPSHPHLVGAWRFLGLPTLCEASSPIGFGEYLNDLGLPGGYALNQRGVFDAWRNPLPWNEVNQNTGSLLDWSGPRVAEDVMMTDVIGFDVKVYDPYAPIFEIPIAGSKTTLVPGDPGYLAALQSGAVIVGYGAYVDLGYAPNYNPAAPKPLFNGNGDPRSGFAFTPFRVYDTGSTHYEHDGLDEDGDTVPDEGSDGFDSNDNGVVDDSLENETSPPYPVPLRGIQIKIRVFERDSRTIREVTIKHDFPMD